MTLSADWKTRLKSFYAARWARLEAMGLDSSGVDPTVVFDPFLDQKTDRPVLIIGEAPGGREVEEGAPFVGPAGANLAKLIVMAGLDRPNDVLITNAFPFRTFEAGSKGVKNRTPGKEELALGAKLLLEELAIVQPRMILILGGSAYKAFMKLDAPELTRALKGMEEHSYLEVKSAFGFSLILGKSFHPSPLVYNIAHKREALQAFFKALNQALTA